VIRRTHQPARPEEAATAGVLYGRHDRVFTLRPGRYVYLVTSSREMVLARKYQVGPRSPGVARSATHRSLANLYRQRKGRDAKIVAAGQFAFHFGQILRVDNRSGTFRGDENSLMFAIRVLSDAHLKLNGGALVESYDPGDPEPPSHTPVNLSYEEYQLQEAQRVNDDPLARAMMHFYEDLGGLLLQHAPDGSLESALRGMLATAEARRDFTGFIEFTYPFESARSADGLAFAIAKLTLDSAAPDSFVNVVLRQSGNILEELAPLLSRNAVQNLLHSQHQLNLIVRRAQFVEKFRGDQVALLKAGLGEQ